MSEKHDTDTIDAATAAETEAPAPALDPEAGLQGAAAFADAETREILNLLGDAEAGGSCCGGSCCA